MNDERASYMHQLAELQTIVSLQTSHITLLTERLRAAQAYVVTLTQQMAECTCVPAPPPPTLRNKRGERQDMRSERQDMRGEDQDRRGEAQDRYHDGVGAGAGA